MYDTDPEVFMGKTLDLSEISSWGKNQGVG